MRTILLTVLLSALLGGGGVYVWKYYGGFSNEQQAALAFIDAYSAYTEVAERVESLVHLPGTEGNSDRSQLLTLLNAILTDDMENGRREELARVAFNNLTALKNEVDGAQTAQASLYVELQRLDAAARSFTSVAKRAEAEAIVSNARTCAELSARITSVLSEMNEQTYAIITRILEDKGDLTPAHVTEINAATAAAETRFDLLKGLYADLLGRRKGMEGQFTTFAHRAL